MHGSSSRKSLLCDPAGGRVGYGPESIRLVEASDAKLDKFLFQQVIRISRILNQKLSAMKISVPTEQYAQVFQKTGGRRLSSFCSVKSIVDVSF